MKSIFAAIASFLLAASAKAAITISDFSITTNSMSFTITGTIEVSATLGSNLEATMLMGVPGDNDWINAQATIATVTNHGGPGVTDVNTVATIYTPFPNGDYFYVHKYAGGGAWAHGDTVNSSVTMFGPANSLVPANLNIEDIIVTVGYNSPSLFPDTDTQVGAIAVPEPSSVLLGLIGLLTLSRRQRHLAPEH